MTQPLSPNRSAWAFPFLPGILLLILFALAANRGEAAAPGSVTAFSLTGTPLIRRTPEGERAVAQARIVSGPLTNATVQLRSPGWPEQKPFSLSLPSGTNSIELDLPYGSQRVEVTARLESPDGVQELGPFTLTPPRKWTIYLTQHTHTDIGYTRPQTEILPEHLRYLDYALDYCDQTDRYPEDAKFRWTCETSWAVREYLQRRPAAQIARLRQRVQEGRIEVAGLLLNMAEIASESTVAALLQPLHEIKAELGAPVRTAMQNDVNGAAWCLVDYFQGLGIRYLTMGINQTRSILPFDQPTPFWWESPSGNRVLAYRSDHYMTANFWGIEKGDAVKMKPGVVDYLRSLEGRDYPFDRIGVQFSGYFTDNSPPSTIACDLVKTWNETYAWPKLRLSTAQEFLGYVEQEHGKELAVHRQAWPDWWTDGFGSAARETAAARETESAMQVSEGLLALAALLGADPRPGVLDRIRAIRDDLLFYAEHTYGAAESISDPMAENSQVQWGEKGSYVWNAVKQSNLLREEAFGQVQGFVPRADVPTIAVFNTLNWDRSGVAQVFIDHQILPADREVRMVDAASGRVVPAQPLNRRTEGTYWALAVNDVPSLGYRVLRIEAGREPRATPPPAAPGPTLETAFYRLTLDPERGGIHSLVDKETGRELVDAASPWSLGQCIYETLVDRNEKQPKVKNRTSLRQVKIEPGARGPIWRSLLVSGEMDGCVTNGGVKVEIRLYETEKRLELDFALRKLPIPDPEAVYVAFPFQAPDSRLLYEAQGGCVTPGDDQIPGSSSDWQTFQHFVAVRSPQGQIVWGSEQAPLVQLGDFNLGKWQRVAKVDKPHVYSWVMNNYWFTNFRATQEGEFRWHYYLTSLNDTSRTAATRFGWASRIPLAARVSPAGKAAQPGRPWTLSALRLREPNALLIGARPSAGGDGILCHVREIEGRGFTAHSATVECLREIRQADVVNVLEEPMQTGVESVEYPPFASKLTVLRFR